jgi:hypothetical protein
MPVVECPAPPRPELPGLDPASPLDSPANIETIMLRESCVECYRTQIEAGHD